MANRIVGNVYIIDSQTGIANALQPGSVSWPTQAKINTILFWGADSSARFEMVFAADTTASAFGQISNTVNVPNLIDVHLGEPTNFEELRCKTLTAGTGFLILS